MENVVRGFTLKSMFVHLQYALNTDKNVVCFTETHSW
jgi:hypothetical protein